MCARVCVCVCVCVVVVVVVGCFGVVLVMCVRTCVRVVGSLEKRKNRFKMGV